MEECPYSDFKKIGEGGYGSVFKVLTKNGNYYALKQGLLSLNEVDLMSRLRHPYLARILQFLTPKVCPEVEGSAIVMPLASGDLHQLIHKIYLAPKIRIQLMSDIAKGLAFLHSIGVLHLDLKLENILYQGLPTNPHPLIADFGLAQYVDDPQKGRYINRRLVTITYRAPEILQGSRIYNAAVDIWSLGILFVEILSRKSIYYLPDINNITKEDLLHQIDQRFADPVRKIWIRNFLKGLNPKYLSHAVDLLSSMLNPDPTKRATMSQILKSKLFQSFDAFVPGENLPAEPIELTRDDPLFDRELNWLLSIFFSLPKLNKLPISALFLGVDLYVRLLPYLPEVTEDQDFLQIRTLATTVILMVLEMIADIPIEHYDPDLQKYTGIPKEYIDLFLPEVIFSLDGNLYPYRLYNRITSRKQLKEAYPYLTSVKRYAHLDLDQWIEKHPPDQSSKEITIKDYYLLLLKK